MRHALARLADGPDLEAFLDHVLAAGVEQLAATSNALFTFDAASRTFRLRAFVLGAGARAAWGPGRRDAAPVRWNAPAGGSEPSPGGTWPPELPAVETDPTTWPRSAHLHEAVGHGPVLSVPLLLGGRLLGFTVAHFAERTAPSTEQIGVAGSLAIQAALALELLQLAADAKAAALVRARVQAASGRMAEPERTGNPLQATTDALGRLTELDGVITAVLGTIGRTFTSTVAAFFDVGTDARASLRHCIANGRALTAPEFLASDVGPLAVRERFAGGFVVPNAFTGLPARLRTRATVIDHRARTDDLAVDAWTRDLGCELELNVLSIAGDGTGRMLAVYRSPDLPYNDAEVALAEALATLLTLAGEHAVACARASEQGRAAVEHATVLQRADGALRRWTARIAAHQGATATTLLEVFVLEAVAVTGAVTGVFVQRVDDVRTECTMLALVLDGTLALGCNDQSVNAEFRAATEADRAGVMRRTLDGEAVVYPVAGLAAWYPDSHAYHHARHHSMVGHFPIHVGGAVTGYLGLVWPADAPPDGTAIATSRALATRASLALETQRLADEARAAAVVAERHAAATAVADERTRLAREMHDTLAQGLAGIVMQLGAARDKLGPAYATAAPQLDLVDRLARDTLAVARRAITVLRPAAPEAEGLDVGLRRMLEEPGASFGGRLTFEVTGTPRRAPAGVEFELLRIAHAALANAVQHGGAAHIAVTLDYGSASGGGGAAGALATASAAATSTAISDSPQVPALRLAVADDGVGFEDTALRPGHFGLVGMRERAARVGAALTLVTAPGEGTEVVVVWPDAGATATGNR